MSLLKMEVAQIDASKMDMLIFVYGVLDPSILY